MLCLFYSEQQVNGNYCNGRQQSVSLSAVLCVFTGADELPPPSDLAHTFGARLQVLRWEACRMPSSVQASFAQTCAEPSGLCESCLSRLTYSPLSGIHTEGRGTPSLSSLFRMLHQEKSCLEQMRRVWLGEKASSGAWKPLPLQGEKQRMQSRLSQPHTACLQEENRELA